MDRGRMKKFKPHNNNNFSRDNPGYNPFSEQQIQSNNRNSHKNRWNHNNNNSRICSNHRPNSYHYSSFNKRGKNKNRNSFYHNRGNNNRFNR